MPRKKPDGTAIPINLILFLPVNFLKTFLFFLFIGLSGFQAMAQDEDAPSQRKGSRIIDDTTKQIYGPNTSRYYFEKDVFYNTQTFHSIDTAIRNFHRFDYVQKNGNLYQDLGVIGTAIRPLYYQAPDVIGRRSGAHVYDLYWDSEPVIYYDTKSPYSNMKVILGGRGRSVTRATYSRNITPQWNFGFTYRGLPVDKQIQHRKNERLVRGNYYDAYTTFQSKDSSYRLFANFRRSYQKVKENGGVKLPNGPLDLKDFVRINAQPWLTNAESGDLRMNFHLFHQYSLGSGLQLYNTFDRYRQMNKFTEFKSADNKDFYDFNEIDRDSVLDVTKFKAVRTEVGFKGNLSKLFYNGYYAIRHYSMYNVHFNPDSLDHITFDSLREFGLGASIGNESYLGGRISLKLDSIGQVNGMAEVMRDPGSKTNGEFNYQIQGEIKSKWFEARLKQMKYSPGYIEQAYRGAFDSWNNKFSSIESSQINGYLHYKSSIISISPGMTFTRLKNYVFYKQVSKVDTVQRVLPIQSSGNQIIFSPEARLSLTFFKHITLSGQAIYTRLLENADSAITVPELFVNGQLSYSNIFFNGNMDMHGGVDFHWKSAYKAMGYDPAIRQFYIQNAFTSPAFPIVDIFFNIKIKRGRVFFKYNNIMQAFKKSGYLPTPYYPGVFNSFDFGFDWSFYD